MTSTTQVFIPGLLSDSRVWRPLAKKLNCESSSYFVDVSGLQSLRTMAEDILCATDGPLDVFGHSMGGRIAFELFDLAPERVASLILADTGVHPLAAGETSKRETVISVAHEQGMIALCESWLPPMLADKNRQNHSLVSDLQAMVLAYTAEQHENQIRALINRNNAESYLKHITCPVLLVVGSEDKWSSPEQHQEIALKIQSAKLDIIAGAGHFAPLEDVDAFAYSVSNWRTTLYQ
jgi:pimeloyl-ACP methyl ester carboxylesterase